MKKIININLSGRVIPIEDSAYEKLQVYIESLRKYFAKEEGRDEIINDIESRIAELMNDKVRVGAGVITDADVDVIIASMGRPEDFEAADADDAKATPGTGAAYTYTETKKPRGRLYRDSSDKILGGVCSGLASYLNVDPAIVRLLFAIFSFGAGFGFLLYILLWIILPSRSLDEYGGKRLYRNPDDRMIAGVCGGIAAYFNWEVWAVRLVFGAPLVLNILVSIMSGAFFHFEPFPSVLFGSLTGTFILAYIVLWIVLPQARTSYQKMEMRGEKIDVNTISQNVKTRAEQFSNEVRSSAENLGAKARQFADTRGRAFATEVSESARPIGSSIGRVIGLLFKVFFLFIAGTIAFGLFVGLTALIVGGVGVMPLKNFLLNGVWQNVYAWGTIIFFLAVPLIAFITWLVRRIMKIRSQGTNYLGWTFGGLWTLGWVCLAFLIGSIVRDTRTEGWVTEPVTVTQPQNKMVVQVNEPMIRYSGNYWWFDADDRGWDLTEDTIKMANIKIQVLKSDDSAYHVSVHKYSVGSNIADAEQRAQNVKFNIFSTDSFLNVGSGLAIGSEDKFRAQEVVVEIRVPVGKQIRFDESVAERLRPWSIRTKETRRNWQWGRRGWDFEVDWDNYFDWDMNTDYTMTAEGKLVDPTKPVAPKTREELEREIREKERQIEEDRRKLEQDKRRLRDSTLSSTKNKKESLDEMDKTYTVTEFSSPVLSVLRVFN